MSDNSFWGDEKMIFTSDRHLSSSQNKLSDVNKTYINISNGQKFELLVCKRQDYFKRKRIKNYYFSNKNIKRFWRKIQIGNFLNYNDCNYCDVLGNYSYLGWIKNILLTLIKEASEELKMKVEMNINI